MLVIIVNSGHGCTYFAEKSNSVRSCFWIQTLRFPRLMIFGSTVSASSTADFSLASKGGALVVTGPAGDLVTSTESVLKMADSGGLGEDDFEAWQTVTQCGLKCAGSEPCWTWICRSSGRCAEFVARGVLPCAPSCTVWVAV